MEPGELETSAYRKPTHTDKYLAFDSHHPICHKKSIAKLWSADCPPSSLDQKAEGRKYVSNVLKVIGYTKVFSVTAENQLQLVAFLMRGNQRLVSLLFPTFGVLRNPSREFSIVTTLRLLRNLFRLQGIFLPSLRIRSRKHNALRVFMQ